MGGPASSLLADVLMNNIVDKAMDTSLTQRKPIVFYRYVDDCFAVFNNKRSVVEFENILNSMHPNIKFTTEMQTNNSLRFLDVLVNNSQSTLSTSTFRKPTHTGLFAKWSSFVPRRYKVNLVNCLLDRCYKICSFYELICEEVEHIKTMLSRNGYPKYFLDKCVREFFNRKFKPKQTTTSQDRRNLQSKRILIRLPFLGAVSEQVRNELNSFLRKRTDGRVKLSVIDTTSKIGNNFHLKDRQPLVRRSGVVYKVRCSCNMCYIGQTRRNLETRLREHSTSEASEVCRHLLENPGHRIDFARPEILGNANDTARLLILESLFIQEQIPDLNIDSKSAPLYLFNT